MSKQTINIGASPNDGTGTPLRTSFDYTNQNFTELYTALGGGVGLPGATTQVIFNDGGTNLAGDAGLVYNKTTDALTVAGLVTAGSATITGDLTVRTNKLIVTNTGVGVGMTPITPLSGVIGTTGAVFFRTTDPAAPVATPYIQAPVSTGFSSVSPAYGFWYQACGIGNPALNNVSIITDSAERYKIDITGVSTWSVAGTTAMTLNSTGLGIGASPVEKLTVAGKGLFVSANPDNSALKLEATTGTNSVAINFLNTGGNYFVGVDNSVGGRLYGVPYSLCIGSTGAYPVVIATNNTARLTVDSSGNVGIGVTPSAWGSQYRALQIFNNSALYGASAYGYYGLLFNGYNDNTDIKAIASLYVGEYRYELTTGAHKWFGTTANATAGATAAPAQAMTLDASGNLLVGLTVDSFTPAKGVSMFSGNSSRVAVGHANGTSSGDYYHSFAYNSTLIGSISQNGTTGVLYNTSSDYRLKESVKPISGGLARVNALKPSVYNWKSDGSTGEGFLAHELAEVVPFAVSGEKDAVNADGTIKSQGIDMSRIVPILVAAIQELTARVQTIEAK